VREGWSITTFGEVCQIKPPKKEAKARLTNSDSVSFVPMDQLGIRHKAVGLSGPRPLGEVYSGYTYFAENDVLLAKITPCFENGKLGIARGLTNNIGFGSSEFIVFRCHDKIEPEYLFYFLSQDNFRDAGATVMAGAVGHKRVPKEFINNHEIPLPPLAEQKRIVAILDEAFEGIGRAVANTEKNLANARELFESHLNTVFSQKGGGWICEPFERTIERVRTPNKILKRNFLSAGEFPIVSQEADFINGYWNNGSDLVRIDRPIIVFGDHTRVLKYVDFDFVVGADGVKILAPKAHIFPKFFFYALRSKPLGAKGYARHYRALKAQSIQYPQNVGKQEAMASQMAEVETSIETLTENYDRRIEALANLKQSILQKAFAGELIARPDRALAECEKAGADA
jgi:type I restriction enzyme, S subunit